nr:protocadherin gamma-A8 isoform X4 [Vulpes vulpes]
MRILSGFSSKRIMAAPKNYQRRGKLVLLCALLGTLGEMGRGQIHYSVPEESDKGSFVGNISKDLNLESHELVKHGVRIVSRGRTQLFALHQKTGSLLTAERIDREELCAQNARCLVHINILAEGKGKLFRIEIEITDINDNNPKFQVENVEMKINEIAAPGTRYPLPEAVDPDVGTNSLQSYQLSPNGHFSLDVQTGEDGTLHPELVLEQALDREEEAVHHLVLSASDGGEPRRSSTMHIHVKVLDTNDNAPVFTLPVYRVKVPENVPLGTRLLTVSASDPDEGASGEVVYRFWKISEKQSPLFQFNEYTGEISTAGDLDYEECAFYEMEIQAEDVGALLGRTRVLISVEDVNDNRPEVIITSLFSPVLENTLPGTVIAFLNVHDRDSGKNGQVVCYTPHNLPFQLEKSIDNYYRLVTWKYLDREKISMYNITVMASDLGTPSLSTETYIILYVADINDNPPTFLQVSYSAYIPENNPRGASIFTVMAYDPDSGKNAQVTYSVTEDIIMGGPLSSYVSIDSDTGILYALCSFDYEHIRDLQLLVTASDSGDPPLSSNVSLTVFLLDQNDNTPEILYPALPTDGSTGVELAPRSAEPGYLVTKVVAVDADSGHNAWLSYHVLQASEPGLFSLGLRTGEVRTARALGDRDAARQRLLVAVRDGGQPPLSATATLLLVFADSLQEALPDVSERQAPADPQAELQFYLVVALALISVLFLLAVILAVALRLGRSSSSTTWGCFQPGLCVKSGPVVPPNYSEGTLPYSYNLCVAHTGKTEFNFLKCNEQLSSGQDILLCNDSSGALFPLYNTNESTSDPETLTSQAPPNTDWRFSQAQRPGTSGSQNGDETGTWPNNQFDTEMLQAMILASASEAADGSSTLGGGAGTMGLSARYGPQFTLQHVPDYRQNVYIPGSNATLTNAAGKRDGKAPAGGNGSKKKSGKKEKK